MFTIKPSRGLFALFISLDIVVAILMVAYWQRASLIQYFFRPTPTSIDQGVQAQPSTSIIAKNLTIPWDIGFLPDGSLLVTQRSGELLHIDEKVKVVEQIKGVKHIGEGGLLGLALHPNFATNKYVYLYLTSQDSGQLTNRVERYTYDQGTLSSRTVILEGIKGAQYHDGGRIAFGPDSYLYITTGDAGDTAAAQDQKRLEGKILRVTDDGKPVATNPFANEVYSLGHRNAQGLAWDANQMLWSSEHGPSGTNTGFDEINKIVAGSNYGWPELTGDAVKNGFVAPVIQSGKNETWAPGGLVYWDGSLFFPGLRGESLYEAHISADGELGELKAHLRGEFGRLRTVVLSPDGYFYLTTSNTDGRGKPMAEDDKVIKIDPKVFRE
jgi:glucose/arabinose dehydrogenase